jgi:hypothetical protein
VKTERIIREVPQEGIHETMEFPDSGAVDLSEMEGHPNSVWRGTRKNDVDAAKLRL